MVRSNSHVMLYVGAGSHRLHGFLHAEISIAKQRKKGMTVRPPEMLCDVTEKIPIADDSVDFIYSRATWEHFTYRQLINHLLECFRVLKPQGIVRACVPDFDKYIADYHAEVFRSGPEWVEPNPDFPVYDHVSYFVYRMMYHDHRYLHNYSTLSRCLTICGFTDIMQCAEGGTYFLPAKEQVSLADDGREQGGEIIVEATKGPGPPEARRLGREWPDRWPLRILAKYMNINVSPYARNRPMFPSRAWFREKISGFGRALDTLTPPGYSEIERL